jgi:hypothetical protein
MIVKPNSQNGWLDNYIKKVEDEFLLEGFKRQTAETLHLFSELTEEQVNYRYAEGKWSIKEILLHLIDCERIFAYRALTFARGDQAALPGFDENEYVINSHIETRDIKSLVEEYIIVRTSTVSLFAGFHPDVLNNRGTANKIEMSVSALGFAILGHEIHHIGVIRERYLKQN